MPRGVKGSGKAKPTRQQRVPIAVPPPAAQVAPVAVADTTIAQRRSPFAPANPAPLASVDVDSLAGDALRTYALRAGVSQRDVQNLTDDRLRQNVKLTIARTFDLITDEA